MLYRQIDKVPSPNKMRPHKAILRKLDKLCQQHEELVIRVECESDDDGIIEDTICGVLAQIYELCWVLNIDIQAETWGDDITLYIQNKKKTYHLNSLGLVE
jgi:hypothetical protein